MMTLLLLLSLASCSSEERKKQNHTTTNAAKVVVKGSQPTKFEIISMVETWAQRRQQMITRPSKQPMWTSERMVSSMKGKSWTALVLLSKELKAMSVAVKVAGAVLANAMDLKSTAVAAKEAKDGTVKTDETTPLLQNTSQSQRCPINFLH